MGSHTSDQIIEVSSFPEVIVGSVVTSLLKNMGATQGYYRSCTAFVAL